MGADTNGLLTPGSLRGDLEMMRRARLLAGLCLMGTVFGSVYSTFYWQSALLGMAIIIVCNAFDDLHPLFYSHHEEGAA